MIPPPNPSRRNQGQQPQQPAAKPAPQPVPAPPKKSSNVLLPLTLTLGFLMLIAVAWLTYNSISTTRVLEQKIAQLEEAEQLQIELENQYNDALTEMDKLKGENMDINNLIDQQKLELESQRSRISSLLREKRKLDAARSEIKNLRTRVASYIAEIEQLKAEQEQLTEENMLLKEATTTLSSDLQSKASENEELYSAKAKLINEKEQMTQAVRLGSVIKVKEIKVTGQKLRKSGKTTNRESAKRVDQLKVCFTTMTNELVEPGTEKFYIRIINPKGETIAIDDLGSGALENTKTGEEVRFTQVKEYEYANDETQLCFVWLPGVPFQNGTYDVEIYNKGYLAGQGIFELK
jgi:myosin heavy subunit